MPNTFLYPSKRGPQGGFYVRRELSADGKRYFYWLGHKTDDQANRVRITHEFYLEFRKEVKRLRTPG